MNTINKILCMIGWHRWVAIGTRITPNITNDKATHHYYYECHYCEAQRVKTRLNQPPTPT